MAATYPKEQVIEAYNNAPALVRAAFNADSTVAVVQAIEQRFGLHVDVAGNLGKQIGYLLLGLASPAEFYGQLITFGIQNAVAEQIVAEVNTKIFLPLQQQMHDNPPVFSNESVLPPQAQPFTASIPENFPPAVPKPVFMAPPAPFSPPPQSVPAPVPTPIAPAPFAPPPQHVAAPQMPPQIPPVRTMAHDMQVMKEAGHPQPISWQPSSPARSFQTSSVPNTTATPSISAPPVTPYIAPAPTASIAPVMPTMPTRPIAAPPPNLPGQSSSWQQSAPAPANNSIPIVKEYSVDPYRETPE